MKKNFFALMGLGLVFSLGLTSCNKPVPEISEEESKAVIADIKAKCKAGEVEIPNVYHVSVAMSQSETEKIGEEETTETNEGESIVMLDLDHLQFYAKTFASENWVYVEGTNLVTVTRIGANLQFVDLPIGEKAAAALFKANEYVKQGIEDVSASLTDQGIQQAEMFRDKYIAQAEHTYGKDSVSTLDMKYQSAGNGSLIVSADAKTTLENKEQNASGTVTATFKLSIDNYLVGSMETHFAGHMVSKTKTITTSDDMVVTCDQNVNIQIPARPAK